MRKSAPRIFLNHTVWEGALDRMRFLFDEFPNIYVSFSGGKDSTIVLELALIVAREKNRLPLNVLFLDQEAEWKCVIDYIRNVMNRSEVRPFWCQIPFRLFNAASGSQPFLNCWDATKESDWVRPREPDSIHENVYGEDRFAPLFPAITKHLHPSEPCATITGIRCQESPKRQAACTIHKTYQHVTWGRIDDSKRGHYTFHPIYDWGQTDVWKAILDNDWEYCKLYDWMYQRRVPSRNMRVSSFCHEGGLNNVLWLQEFEHDTYERIANRVEGMHALGQMKNDFMSNPKELPFMFDTWKEYRDHLLENLITEPSIREKMQKQFERIDKRYDDEGALLQLYKAEILAVLTNDYFMVKLTDFELVMAKKWDITRNRELTK